MEFTKIDLKLNPFEPLLPLLTGHTQTVLGYIITAKHAEAQYTEQILQLDDGDELLLEYLDNKSDKTVSIYHGFTGSSQADYIRRSANLAQDLGWNIVLVNHRGVNSKAKAKKTYHSGRGEDIEAVLKWARVKFRGSKQIALGFSMSGCILLNLLTYRSGEEQPDYAIIVNTPLDLASCVKLLSVGLSKIYDYRFYLTVKKLIKRSEEISLPFLARTSDIDRLYTSKANGFSSAEEYYEKCSTLNYLNQIETKTFVLASHDDPFIDVKDYLKASWNQNTHLTFKKHGGHMGYFANKKDPKHGHRWLYHYLESVFKKIQSI